MTETGKGAEKAKGRKASGRADHHAGEERHLHAEGPEGDARGPRVPAARGHGRARGFAGHARNDPQGPPPRAREAEAEAKAVTTKG